MAQRKSQWPETLDYVTAYGAYAKHDETQRDFLRISEISSTWMPNFINRKTGNTLTANLSKAGEQGSFRREQ
jgi:predicted RNA-binding protein with RPS1 domain